MIKPNAYQAQWNRSWVIEIECKIHEKMWESLSVLLVKYFSGIFKKYQEWVIESREIKLIPCLEYQHHQELNMCACYKQEYAQPFD